MYTANRKRSLRTVWKQNRGQVALQIIFILISACYILPLMLVVSASFTDEAVLTDVQYGFSLFPRVFSLEAYKQVFANPTQLIDSYKITITYSVIATALEIIVLGMMAYPLSRPTFILRKPINFLIIFAMIFAPGMVPSYMLNTRYLHLDNTIWIYILPSIMSAWNLIIIRTNYRAVPFELIEAARLEGANETYICFRIVMPLSKAALASIGFLFLVNCWNNWMTASIYIRDVDKYSLQYMLQRILREAEFIKSMVDQGMLSADAQKVPEESYRYAMAVVSAGPMLVVFPFFQKYFAKGMTLGSVKG